MGSQTVRHHWVTFTFTGFREFTLVETESFLKIFCCWRNMHDVCFCTIHVLKFGSGKTCLVICKRILLTEVYKVIITEDINVIENVIFFFPDSSVLLSFRLHMPERHFLVLTSQSTRLLSKSASSIKQAIYLYPICQWKLLYLRKTDGLRITFHKPLSCPRTI